jgi:hypothetical protein
VSEGKFNHCFVTDTLADARITSSNKGIAYVFPLYLYSNKDKAELVNPKLTGVPRQPNIDTKFYDLLRDSDGLRGCEINHPVPTGDRPVISVSGKASYCRTGGLDGRG